MCEIKPKFNRSFSFFVSSKTHLDLSFVFLIFLKIKNCPQNTTEDFSGIDEVQTISVMAYIQGNGMKLVHMTGHRIGN